MTIKRISQRHRYLDEKEKIKSEIGDLEQIRMTLSLSQRRICQLLLVDPSAWTRWLKTEAPPHIYQALRWLVELKKVNPEAAAPSNMASRLDFVQTSTQAKIQKLEESMALLERSLALTATAQPQISFDDSILKRLAESMALKSKKSKKKKVKIKRAKPKARVKLKPSKKQKKKVNRRKKRMRRKSRR